MSSNYPNSYDTFVDPTASTLLNDPVYDHAKMHTTVNDALAAIEQFVGLATVPIFVPIANSHGATVVTQTPDDVSGANSAKILQLPADQSVLAVNITGDTWPRWLMTADSEDGLYAGPGNKDPYSYGAHFYYDNVSGCFTVDSVVGGATPNFAITSNTKFYQTSGNPNGGTFADLTQSSIAIDVSTPALWINTGGTNTGWSQVGSGGSASVLAPRLLPSVKWALVVPGNAPGAPSWSYNGTWPALATTVTATVNGVLAIDGGSPVVGDRVVVMDIYDSYFQLFTVSNVGSVSTPWVLTATADDITSSAWAVKITQGTFWTGGVAISSDAGTANWYGSVAFAGDSVASGPYSTAYTGSVASGNYSTATGTNSVASGYISVVSGSYSVASGPYSTASGNNSIASGYSSTASGSDSVASGNGSLASGNYSTASGYSSIASGIGSVASGNTSLAYGDAHVVDASVNGNHQSGRVAVGVTTADATPTVASNATGSHCVLRLVNSTLPTRGPVWNRTLRVSGSIVARRTDTPGTDSAWTIPPGVLRGNGTNAYTWVGGTAPVPTVDVQDAAASTWAAALSVGVDPAGTGAAALILTVTGKVANTIEWEALIELDEAAG